MTFVLMGGLASYVIVTTFWFENIWKRLRKLEAAVRELNPGLDL